MVRPSLSLSMSWSVNWTSYMRLRNACSRSLPARGAESCAQCRIMPPAGTAIGGEIVAERLRKEIMSESLREIEQAMVTLWMNRGAREKFLHGTGGKKARQSGVDRLSPELLAGIDKRGVRVYARLLNFGHHDVMLSIYPGCAKLLADKWERVVDGYLEYFPPSHYNFNRTAARFSEFLAAYGDRYQKKFPYIAELADYEWLELEILERDVEIKVTPYEPLTQPEEF